MTRYLEITYDAPLSPPLPNQAWVTQGTGDWRLVVFPGTPARKYLFERFLRTAPSDIEVVLLARPGYGRGHDKAYTDFNDQIACAKPFLEGDKRVITMGVSYGGELALKAALDFPDVVEGVVTVAALINEPRDWVHPFVDLGGAPVIRDLLPKTLHFAREEVEGRRAQIGPLFARLKDMTRPVSIMHGNVDHLVAKDDAKTLAGYFGPEADVSMVEVSGGTHFLELQNPNQVYDAVRDVISRTGNSLHKDQKTDKSFNESELT